MNIEKRIKQMEEEAKVFYEKAYKLWEEGLKEKCDREGLRIRFLEPYIPYVPKNWNGVLILCEAQNLSNSSIREFWSAIVSITHLKDGRYLAYSPKQRLHLVGEWDEKIYNRAV